jgi:hypothetical protein
VWNRILEGITGSSVEELILPAKQWSSWGRVLVEGGILLGFLATASWLVR